MVTDPETLDHEPREPARRSRTPGWVAEVVEVMELRRGVLLTTALGLSLLGVLTALALPGFLPPRPLVGFAVGLAAVLLAVAVALGVDSVDLRIRGPRHVRASGGRLAAQLAGPPDAESAAPLAAAVARRVEAGRTRIALTPASAPDDEDVAGWADALARALSARDLRVLLVDLVPEREGRLGLADVAAGTCRLAEAVDFDHDLMLASVGPGRNRREALDGLAELAVRLPSDIEVLVVALPHLGEPGALAGAGSLDRVLVVVEADATPRVDLIAALDALDTTPVGSEVVLLDPVDRPMVTAWELVAASVPPMPAASTAPAAADVPSVVEDLPVDEGGAGEAVDDAEDGPEAAGASDVHVDGAFPDEAVGPTGAAPEDAGAPGPSGDATGSVHEEDAAAPEEVTVPEDAGGADTTPGEMAADDTIGGEEPATAEAPVDAHDEGGDAEDAVEDDGSPIEAVEPDDPLVAPTDGAEVDPPGAGDLETVRPEPDDGQPGAPGLRDESSDVWEADDAPVAAAPDDPLDDESSDDGLTAAAAVAAFEAERAAGGLDRGFDPDEPQADPAWEPRAPEPTSQEEGEAARPFAGEEPADAGLADATDELEPVLPFSRPDETRRDDDRGASEGTDDDVPSVIRLDDDPAGDVAYRPTERGEPTAWTFPGEDDGPTQPGSLDTSPFEDQPDRDDDPLRVAAALQTLAHEVWSREEQGD